VTMPYKTLKSDGHSPDSYILLSNVCNPIQSTISFPFATILPIGNGEIRPASPTNGRRFWLEPFRSQRADVAAAILLRRSLAPLITLEWQWLFIGIVRSTAPPSMGPQRIHHVFYCPLPVSEPFTLRSAPRA
jgi:hypothetical protein